MKRFTLPRSGQAPLTFNGELIASSEGQQLAGRDRARWHDLAIYRTTDNRYVVGVSYQTIWQGEIGYDIAEVAENPAAVLRVFRSYNPIVKVWGYPPGPNYADRQKALLAELVLAYESQVSIVLNGPEFAESI